MTSRDREWSAFTDRMAIEGRALESVHAEMRADLSRIFMMLCEIWAKLDTLQNRKGGANRPTDSGISTAGRERRPGAVQKLRDDIPLIPDAAVTPT